MTIENMSKEELNEALLNDIAAEDSAYEGTNSEQEGELEENTQEEETETQDGGQEEEVEVSEPVEKLPKSKSIQKVLSERNELRKRIAELEAQVWTSREVDMEYINAIAKQAAVELRNEDNFFDEFPEAIELKQKLKEMTNVHNVDLNMAYNMYLMINNPDELRIQENKKNAKKFSSPSYSASKLKSTPSASDLSTGELESKIKELIGKWEFKIY